MSLPGARHRRFTPAVVLAIAGCLLTSVAVTGASAASCRAEAERRDVWSPVPVPAEDPDASVVQLDDDPCMLLAAGPGGDLWRSTDGGYRWSGYAKGGVARLFAEGLGAGTALYVTTVGAVYVTHDSGRRFSPAKNDPTGTAGNLLVAGEAVAAAASPDSRTIYLATTRPSATVLYASSDGGAHFVPVPGAAPLNATALAVDPTDPAQVWLADDAAATGAVGHLWSSGDGGRTFQPRRSEPVTDLSFVRRPDGGRTLLVGTPTGLLRTVNGGSDWTVFATGRNVSGVRAEVGAPDILVGVVDGTARRSTNSGTSFAAAADGLPTTCRPAGLARDAGTPSTFLLRCGTDGPFYRRRATGSDFANGTGGTGSSTPGTPGVPPGGVSPPMRVLRTYPVLPDTGSSGALAFDGHYLYYIGDTPERHNAINRIDARTGAHMSAVPFSGEALSLSYDTTRDRLIVGAARGFPYFENFLWEVDPRSGAAVPMFKLGRIYTGYNYDRATDGFRYGADSSREIAEYDRTGRKLRACTFAPISQYGISALTAAGDGDVYVQLEDDATMLRVTRSCEITGMYSHRIYSESAAEDDSIACDTSTFDVPAIWIRDSYHSTLTPGSGTGLGGTVTAYEVPSAYCPLPSELALAHPAGMDLGDHAPVCATLRRAGRDELLAGLPVTLYVDGLPLGTATTDARGTACRTFVAGRVGAGRHAVLGVFLGSRGYGAASAAGSVLVVANRAGDTAVPPAGARDDPQAGLRNPIAAPGAGQPATQVQPQPQPQTQPQTNPQSQTNPNAAAVTQRQQQEQARLAGVTVAGEQADGELAMIGRERDPALPFVAAALLLAAGYAVSARRSTEVVPQDGRRR